MGEYAKFNGEKIKIGTCETMYYLRYDQRFMVTPLSGNVNPTNKQNLEVIRFRFPFPEEDNKQPGNFEPFYFTRIDGVPASTNCEHYKVQFQAKNGYLVSLPCPESGKVPSDLTIHKNGYGGAVHLAYNAVRNGKLVPIFSCGGCGAMWRIEDSEELQPYISAVVTKAENERGESREYWMKIAERMQIVEVQP